MKQIIGSETNGKFKTILTLILLGILSFPFLDTVNAQFSVTGPTLVCSSGQFTVQNYNNETLVWSSTSNLTLTSTQGQNPATFSANGNGVATVTATITCCGKTESFDSPSVWVGPPIINNIICETGETGTAGSSSSFSLWSDYPTISLPQYNVDASPATVWYNYQAYTRIYFPFPDTYYISVEVSNTCGSNYDGRYFLVE